MSDEQVSPPNDYCSRCKRTGFELFFIEYKPGYGDGSIIANSVCRDCREQMRHIVASNITLTAAPVREDGVRERRLELALAEIEGRSNVTTGGHSTLAQRLEHIHALAAQALAASAPVCVCGHSKADHAEKHGWECSEECACLKYTPAPACDGYHHPQGSCPDCAKES